MSVNFISNMQPRPNTVAMFVSYGAALLQFMTIAALSCDLLFVLHCTLDFWRTVVLGVL